MVTDYGTTLYATFAGSQPITRIGFRLGFCPGNDPNSGQYSNGTLAIALNSNLIQQMAVHVFFHSNGFGLTTRDGNGNWTQLASQPFTPALPADCSTTYPFEANIFGSTIVLNVNGQTLTYTNPQVASFDGPFCFWELVQPIRSVDKSFISSVWASYDPVGPPPTNSGSPNLALLDTANYFTSAQTFADIYTLISSPHCTLGLGAGTVANGASCTTWGSDYGFSVTVRVGTDVPTGPGIVATLDLAGSAAINRLGLRCNPSNNIAAYPPMFGYWFATAPTLTTGTINSIDGLKPGEYYGLNCGFDKQ